MVGAVRDRLGDLPADRAAALAHDRRPPRARARDRPPAQDADADPGRLRARVPGRRADLPRRRSRTRSTARPRSTGCWSSPCWPTRRATSRAAGWPGISGSRSTAGSCSWRRPRGCCSRSRSRSGSPSGADRWSRWAWPRRRSSRSSSCRWRSRAGRKATARKTDDEEALGLARGGRFAVAVLVIMAAEQTLLNARRPASRRPRRRGRRLRVQRAADRARAAAALPGGPGLAPPPPRRARGHAGQGGVRARDPDHDPGHRRLRGRRRRSGC